MFLLHSRRFLFFTLLVISITCCIPFESETQVLLKLKQQWLTSPSLQTWNSSVHHNPCNWSGIECSNNNSITAISLPNQNITTSIPTFLCHLPNLSFLNLSFNSIPAGFPTVLYNCLKLQTLDLSFNNFQGPLPNDIYKLSNLQYLEIAYNSFTGDIPSSIGQLTKLTYLGLRHNLFNGTFPNEIGNLINLETLAMGNNSLFVPRAIPMEFGKLKNLKYLYMWGCNLIGHIPPSFANFSSLMGLDLSANKLIGAIPDLGNLRKLEILYLFNNKLSGSIPNSLTNLTSLLELGLYQNNLVGDIPVGIGNLQKLEKLYLYNNKLSGPIPSSLTNLTSLLELLLANNQLCGSIPVGIGNLRRLEKLYLYNNKLSGTIPSSLTNITSLLDLSLPNNQLCGSIPDLGNLRKLEILYLYNNKLSGPIPSSLTNLTSLLDLSLGNNQLCGSIPDFNAKVADFGLAKISTNRTGEPYTASAIAGTIGYIAPEYSRTRRLNEKIDVYSFGVVLLELATGKGPRRGNEYMNLADWSRQQYYHEEFPVEDALDARIKEPRYLEEMIDVFKLGVMCTCPVPLSRPSMRQVSELLIYFKHEEVSDTTLTENSHEDVETSSSMESHILG